MLVNQGSISVIECFPVIYKSHMLEVYACQPGEYICYRVFPSDL